MEKRKVLNLGSSVMPAVAGGVSTVVSKIIADASNKAIKGTPQNPLEPMDLPQELKTKITEKYMELRQKFPHMKPNRLIKKAGEVCGIKFILE